MISNLLEYLDYHKRTVIMASGYLVVLASIPLSFMLIQSSQIFRSQASEFKPPSTSQTITSQEVPSSSPLEDLKALSESQIPESLSSTPSSIDEPSSAVSFGPTLKFLLNFEGRAQDNNGAEGVFVGIATGSPTTNPTYLLTFSVDVPGSGIFSGLSLAGLTSGSTYTAYIKGPGTIDKAVEFAMSATETNLNDGAALGLISGDLNEDNQVTQIDYVLVSSLYYTTSSSSNWNPNADFNADGIVNQLDINTVKANLGKIGDSGIWVSPPPPPTSGASSSSAAGGYDASSNGSFSNRRTGGYWIYLPPIN